MTSDAHCVGGAGRWRHWICEGAEGSEGRTGRVLSVASWVSRFCTIDSSTPIGPFRIINKCN